MTTAIDLISRSLRTISVYGANETINAADTQTGLECLNDVIDSWNTARLYLYQNVTVSAPATLNDGIYTIGPTGDLDGARPTSISNITYSVGDIDYPLTPINRDQYAQITDKTTGGIPALFYYEPTFPLGTLTFWPLPATAGTIKVQYPQPLPEFATTNTDIVFPPGYRETIHYALCIALANEFSVPLPAQIAQYEMRVKRRMRRLNVTVPILNLPWAVLPVNYYGDLDA